MMPGERPGVLYVYIYPMSIELPERPARSMTRGRIVIVASRYNERFTDALLENCLQELQETAPSCTVEVVRVPGAYEVPVAVKRAIVQSSKTPHVVIGLGVIIKGGTDHADLIGKSVTYALQQIALETLVPVIHEVILVNDEKQAFARCIASTLNRGREAARAAVAMMEIEKR